MADDEGALEFKSRKDMFRFIQMLDGSTTPSFRTPTRLAYSESMIGAADGGDLSAGTLPDVQATPL